MRFFFFSGFLKIDNTFFSLINSTDKAPCVSSCQDYSSLSLSPWFLSPLQLVEVFTKIWTPKLEWYFSCTCHNTRENSSISYFPAACPRTASTPSATVLYWPHRVQLIPQDSRTHFQNHYFARYRLRACKHCPFS